jgi:hypothetical protein
VQRFATYWMETKDLKERTCYMRILTVLILFHPSVSVSMFQNKQEIINNSMYYLLAASSSVPT